MAETSQAASDRSIHDVPLTETLARFCIDTPADQVPASAIASVKDLILDTLGVALLASSFPVGRLISAHVAALGQDPAGASVLGPGNLRAGIGFAAQANGTMANALDFDGGGHIPTHLLPAVLAVAETESLSGREALVAFVLAYEAASRLTKVIDAKRAQHEGPTYRGWWHVGLIAPIAAALATCRLKGADVGTTRRAIGIATASSAGFRRSMGTMTKALHSGNGARGGIEAALLAMAGFTGDPEILEAPLGFVAALTQLDERDPVPVMERLGRPFALETSPGVKRFPAVTPSHGVISASLALAERGGFDINDIVRVEADYRTFSLTAGEAGDEEQAGFCAPHLIAASLVRGALGADEISARAVADPQISHLRRRVVQIPKTDGEGNLVRLIMRDGRAVSARAKGQRAYDREFISQKFKRCAGAVLDARGVDAAAALVAHIEVQETVEPLMRLCRGGGY